MSGPILKPFYKVHYLLLRYRLGNKAYYANSVWNPYRMGLIKDLEKVQMRATKLVMKLKHLKYKERLERLPIFI